MEINLSGQVLRFAGAETAVGAALRARLVASGAVEVEGVPDLLILSAPLLDASGFDWDGLAEEVRSVGAAMKATGRGRVVFLLTASAALPVRRQAELSARMAGLQAVMRTLAMSLAPEVAVNALGCGAIEAEGELVSGDVEMIGHASVGRAGTVGEACGVALFLCDPENTYLTGQLLVADGGWSAGYGRSF
jgi:NAD(P)-dependent dehydrogenase (short-subunit alcohol dehydrogenase family)